MRRNEIQVLRTDVELHLVKGVVWAVGEKFASGNLSSLRQIEWSTRPLSVHSPNDWRLKTRRRSLGDPKKALMLRQGAEAMTISSQ